MLTFEQASSNNPPGAAAHANWVYRIPFLAGVPVSIASPALGMVQGAIDEFTASIGARITRGAVAGGGHPMAQFPQVQSRIAAAAAALDAAKLLLKRDTREVESGAASGQFISIDDRIRNRRDQAYAVRLAVQAVDALFEVVGGGGLQLSSGVQRAWRDVNAVSHHISLNWDVVSAMYGQHYLGLEPKGQY
jgi:alkylation response protein AidB-like acyl-CoA dehydrogenase